MDWTALYSATVSSLQLPLWLPQSFPIGDSSCKTIAAMLFAASESPELVKALRCKVKFKGFMMDQGMPGMRSLWVYCSPGETPTPSTQKPYPLALHPWAPFFHLGLTPKP